MRLENKIAILTGASSDIGIATAVTYVKEGAKVLLAGRNQVRMEKTAREIEKIRGKCEIYFLDLRDTKSIDSFVRDVENSVGQIDNLTNFAGVWHNDNGSFYNRRFTQLNSEEIEDAYKVCTGTQLLTRGLIPIISLTGSIINMSCDFESNAAGAWGECKNSI